MELTDEDRKRIPHFDQQAVKPPSVETLVLVYCKKCRAVKPKDGHDCPGDA